MGVSRKMMSRLVIFAIGVFAATVYAQTACDTADIPAIAIRQELCPPSAPFFGFMGCAAALVFACLGAAYGTAKSGVGVANMGVLGIYGLIVAVLLASGIKADDAYTYSSYSGFSALSAGLCCGLAGLSAGIAIGIAGDAGVRANARQPKLFVGIILILIFAEALGPYGLIVSLILSGNTQKCTAIHSNYCWAQQA